MSAVMGRGELRVAADSWHYKVYRHWANEIANEPPATINLCHYMRAVLIYTPGFYAVLGVTLVFVGLAAWLFAPLIFLYCESETVQHRLERIGRWFERNGEWLVPSVGVSGIVTALVLASLDIWWFGLAIFGGVLLLVVVVAAVAIYVHSRKRVDREEPTSSATSLSWQWVKAKKSRICPFIRVAR